MNFQIVDNILSQYKHLHKEIYKEEIYKWQAIKCFQDNWNVDSPNFYEMLNSSLAKSQNLLSSNQYWPQGMILHFANLAPEETKEMFNELFDEENDLLQRIRDFRENVNYINDNIDGRGLKHYQDDRAIMVYLTLRYPDRYYLYKFNMFKSFSEIVGYPNLPKLRDESNVIKYMDLCRLVRAEVLKDKELLDLQNSVITSNEYQDLSANILTQNIIYSAVRHIDYYSTSTAQIQNPILNEVPNTGRSVKKEISLVGRTTNREENDREKKRIGDKGELLVLEFEKKKCLEFSHGKVPEQVSKTKGDGLGYDILSFDDRGNEIFIEVKTTKSGKNAAFFITDHELKCSVDNGANFFLYRLFNYDEATGYADFFKIKGDLTAYCVNPKVFEVVLMD